MYRISVKVGNRTASGTIDADDLTPEQIQARGWGILGPSVSHLLPKAAKGKKGILPEIKFEKVNPLPAQIPPETSQITAKAEFTGAGMKEEAVPAEELSLTERITRLEEAVFGKPKNKKEDKKDGGGEMFRS